DRRLPRRLLDLDAHANETLHAAPLELLEEPARDVVGQSLRGRVLDRKKRAISPWHDPLAILVGNADPLLAELDRELARFEGDEEAMVELVRDLAKDALERDEIEHEEVLVEDRLELGADAIVVTVEPLAL